MSRSIPDLLAAWRAADRAWERRRDAGDEDGSAAAVIDAWLAYQNAILAAHSTEFMLLADEDGRYVAATNAVSRLLGYDPETLVGKSVADLAAPDLAPMTPDLWTAFLVRGESEGRFTLRASDGRLVDLRFRARAHHPVPGFHLSRLWLDEG